MKWCKKNLKPVDEGRGRGLGLRYLLRLLHYNKPVHTCYICGSAGIHNATVMMITQAVTLTVNNNDLTLRL